MPRYYAKSAKAYDSDVTLDAERIVEAMRRHRGRKRPTSVALEESTIRELKQLSRKLDLPYQVLMRALIIDGMKRLKSAA